MFLKRASNLFILFLFLVEEDTEFALEVVDLILLIDDALEEFDLIDALDEFRIY